ncbi:RelA/SpoT family protein [Candidatus Parcubacteria bacterium]|nr:MAG: RelA/SpoT family protein [Candidatus Parcubacteria bacterium]
MTRPNSLQKLLGRIKENPTGPIARALEFSKAAHANQKRESGEPFFNHSLAVAEILYQWKLDDATIVAGLLHDTVEDTSVSLEKIKSEFGEEVSFLVDGVTKLGRIKYQDSNPKVENLRKMVLALSRDLRVVFIKLADRLHNMRTLGSLPPAKQKRIALETHEIYAPLAYRLGMQNLSGELRDLAFPFIHPKENEWIKKTSVPLFEARLKYLERIKPVIKRLLDEQGIKPITIDFRAKRYSSLYEKLLRHEMDMEKIYDLVAMRIIVETVLECYAVLGVIHQKWPPLPGRVKDYIAMPKPNSYRSIHTTVIGPDEQLIEFQIRTTKMHEENEYGIAAHWLYDQERRNEEKNRPRLTKLVEEMQWVKQLRNWLEKYRGPKTDPEEFIQAMKIDFFRDRIFAITPKGDVVDLPVGATPVDFAYHIHTEVGNGCVGAKVNNQIVPLDYNLRSGDLVQIITQKNKRPSEDWLKFVKTSIAREHIKAALREKDKLRRSARGPTKTELRVTGENRLGLLKDISAVVERSHLSIVSVHAPSQPGSRFTALRIQCETTDKQKIEKLIVKLKNLKGVRQVSYRFV